MEVAGDKNMEKVILAILIGKGDEFVSDRMSFVMLKDHCCYIISKCLCPNRE
jgi:hypothetical protein